MSSLDLNIISANLRTITNSEFRSLLEIYKKALAESLRDDKCRDSPAMSEFEAEIFDMGILIPVEVHIDWGKRIRDEEERRYHLKTNDKHNEVAARFDPSNPESSTEYVNQLEAQVRELKIQLESAEADVEKWKASYFSSNKKNSRY